MGGDGVRDVRSFFYGRLGAGAVEFQCEEVSAFSKTNNGLRVGSRNFDPPVGVPTCSGNGGAFFGSDFIHYIVCSGILGSESASARK